MNEEYTEDSQEAIVTSSINKAIKTMNNSGVVVLMVPGEITFSYDLPTFVYDNDKHLHNWLLEALSKHIVLLKVSDEKIQKVIEISRECHFDVFTILDFPEQEVSGSAYSMTSSLSRILHSELEMFGKVVSPEPQTEPVSTTAPSSSANAADTNDGKFGALTRKFDGVDSKKS